MESSRTFYEFFAGGGMARAGLGGKWRCLFANDFDPKKAEAYRANWGGDELLVGDICRIAPSQIPSRADLAWASFPCQDLSLAGVYRGLDGARSGTFWPFFRIIEGLVESRRGPKLIVLENVYGAITSHDGKDLTAISTALQGLGFRVGAMVLDAKKWVPQSRPRLFVVAAAAEFSSQIPFALPNPEWHPLALQRLVNRFPPSLKQEWVWWNLPTPPKRNGQFFDIIEEEPTGVDWHTKEQTDYLISLMSDANLEKLQRVIGITRRLNTIIAGTLYRRTRNGVQRAEVRFDEVAGCLRTPTGGSSRQTILVVKRGKVRTRLLSPREAARLMGLPDDYRLPKNYNQAYHLCGDGVVVPAVRYISERLLEPLLDGEAFSANAVAAE